MNKVTNRKKHYGRIVGQIRESRDMKQEELANRIGLSQQTVSKYEQTEDIDEPTLQKLAKGLGVEADYIHSYNPDSHAKTVAHIHDNEIENQTIGGSHTFHIHAVDQLMTMHQNMKELYERMIAEKDRQIAELKRG